MDEIASWRMKIDEIDIKLLELLNERAECAIQIGKIKAENKMDVYDPEREIYILSRLCDKNKGPLCNETVRRLFELLMKESRNLECF